MFMYINKNRYNSKFSFLCFYVKIYDLNLLDTTTSRVFIFLVELPSVQHFFSSLEMLLAV